MKALLAIILTRNEAAHIAACIESLRFADAILVFDSFSTDATVALAKEAGAEVIQHPFANYASQRNAALKAAQGQAEWVLFVDADERVTPELAAEIQAVVQTDYIAGWRIPRHNYIFGKLTLGAGWFPDYQTRLLRVGAAHYDPARQVHELVILDGPEGTLEQPLIHYNYADIGQFHRKQQAYSDYDAHILFEQGIRPKPQNYILQPWRQFWWRYHMLKGVQDGWHGLRLSLLMAWYELRKYRVLGKLWRGESPRPD
jgi:glycosyltransferase involved in cell wall biosynthesis